MEKEYLVRVSLDGEAAMSSRAFRRSSSRACATDCRSTARRCSRRRCNGRIPEQLRFVLVEGKKRQLRRMCELVGLQVVGLKRIRIGGVMLGNLPLGQWRYLRADERF